MTGFGAADGAVHGGRLQVEVRTVNHRHFSVQLKLPANLQHLEQAMRELLRPRLERGHITVTARWLIEPARPPLVRVNLERAREIVGALRELKTALTLTGDIDLGFVARQPEVLVFGEEAGVGASLEQVTPILTEAAEAARGMREREGAALAADLRRIVEAIAGLAARVEAQAPARLVTERERLRRAVGDLLEGRSLEDGRLAQEIALLADRLDVSEELTRLRTHLDACRSALGATEPVGRRLGFLAQEMLREINTIGAKANDAGIAQAVIGMKGEMEKFREQAENVE